MFCIAVSLRAYIKIVAAEELVLLRLGCGADEGLAGTGGGEDADGVSESPLAGGAGERGTGDLGKQQEHSLGRSKLENQLSGRVCQGPILPQGKAPAASSPQVPSSPAALRFCTVNAVDSPIWQRAAAITLR